MRFSLYAVALVLCTVAPYCYGYNNDQTWTTFAYEPNTDALVVAFSPWKAPYGKSYGLETRRCIETFDCSDAASTFPAINCMRSTDAQAIVTQLDMQLSIGSGNTFGGQYMVYEQYNPNLDGYAQDPASNQLGIYICPTLGCGGINNNNYDYIIAENAYWPSLGFVKLNLGGQMPAIGYVAIPGTAKSFLPSQDHVGKLFVTICSQHDCDATTDRYKVLLDECSNPKDPQGQPLCAGVSLTVSNGNPLILYYGPSAKVSGGMKLKMIACTDPKCDTKPVPAELYSITSEFTPVSGNVFLTTRSKGYPAFAHAKSDGKLYFTRCSAYDCSQQTEDLISSGLLGEVDSQPHVAIGPNNFPVITYVREIKLENGMQNAIMIVYCLSETCATSTGDPNYSPPEELAVCGADGSDGCNYQKPKITATKSNFLVNFRDTLKNQDYMIVCVNTTCTPAEKANIQEVPTFWPENECNGLFPRPAASPNKKKSNAGAVAAGVILTLIALVAIAVGAYYVAVIRKGGSWPWEGVVSQPKGLDSYAEL